MAYDTPTYMNPGRLTPLIVCVLILTATLTTYRSSAQVEPSSPYNRFQYHQYKWRSFHTAAFHIYFPYGYDSAARYITTILPEAMERVKHRMTTTLLKTPNIIIYPSVDQLYESNIGLYETIDKTLPTFTQKGNRIVVYYTGSNKGLYEQLHEALVRSIWEIQLENALQAQLPGSNADNIPYWFKEGGIRYFAHQWPVAAEDELRNIYIHHEPQDWQQVIDQQPALSGQAFCYYLTDQYYPQAMSQLYGQVKQKRDLKRAARLITKREPDSLYKLCFDYYKNRFQPYKKAYETKQNTRAKTNPLTIPIQNKNSTGNPKNIKADPEQKNITYTIYKDYKRTVYNYNTAIQKTTKLSTYQLPPWITDHTGNPYPQTEWEGSKGIIITSPQKKGITTEHYSISGSRYRKHIINGIDGVTNLQSAGNTYHISGYRKGQSDIVEYDAGRNRYYPITMDIYDDTYLTDNLAEQHYFLSAKPVRAQEEQEEDTTVPPLLQGIYTITDTIQPVIGDTTEYIQWSTLQTINNKQILTTHNRYGIERTAIVTYPSGQVTTLSPAAPIQYLPLSDNIITCHQQEDSLKIYTQDLQQWIQQNKSTDHTSPWLRDYRKRAAQRAEEDSILNAAKSTDPSFLEGILIPENAAEQKQQRADSITQSLAWNPKKVKPYILQLHSTYFSAQVNNDYFINRYQPYLNYQGQFKFPEIGGMLQSGLTDIFENHHVGIGYRMPAGTEGSDFFFHYKNTAKKTDWALLYFRKVATIQPNPQRNWTDPEGKTYPGIAKVKTHYYSLSLDYPITYYLSAGYEQSVRMDRTIFLATDEYSLQFEDIPSTWLISTLYLKQYKLRPTIPLLHKGYTAGIYIDGFKAYTQNEYAVYGIKLQAAYHQPLYKHITLVAKGQYGTSGGSSNILYNLGGVDNNITVRADSNVIFPQDAPYAFQTLVTPFRGYLQNSLYGNRYAVFNADIYFPVFQTLIPLDTKYQSVNHLQLGIFTDIGTASETWQQPKSNTGWQAAYGFSARTKLAGYPLRIDIAWPGDLSKKPLWYLSLNIH